MKSKSFTWAVVHVWRGIPNSVELLPREDQARSRELELRRSLPPEDEVAVFRVALPNTMRLD